MRRPWNIINQPVYSLLTKDDSGNINMNICTYVTAVSINPKIYMIAIYYNTKTYENLINSDSAVLQLLSKENISLVRGLGKKSGMKIDKDKYLRKKNLIKWKNYDVLDNICGLVELKKNQLKKTHGDHAIVFFDVVSYKTISERNLLTTNDLILKKIIL
tara:strand:+ start:641 stop:1117 length:477 start_codon:yes stop_codon:yes gene_type:complete